MKLRCLGAVLPVVALAAGSAIAQPNDPGTGRLAATAKLWITVKYFHPYLAYQDIDWDKALVEALPTIRAAKSADEYAAATREMLDSLHDPETHMLGGAAAPAAPSRGQKSAADGLSEGLSGPGQRIWVHYGLAPEA